jgi:hypothetical protein
VLRSRHAQAFYHSDLMGMIRRRQSEPIQPGTCLLREVILRSGMSWFRIGCAAGETRS